MTHRPDLSSVELAITSGGERVGAGSRRFHALLGATAISTIGDGMALTAFPLLAERAARDSALLVSAVYAVGELPNLGAAHIGAILDRANRRRLIVSIEWSRAALLVAFGLYLIMVDVPSIALIAGTVFLIGLGQTFSSTGTQASLPDLIPSYQLGRANGQMFSVQSAGDQMIGPTMGGLLFAASTAAPFVADGLSFALAAILLGVALPSTIPLRSDGLPTKIRADVREGFAHFRSDRTLRLVAGMVLVYAFCQSMVLGTLVVFVRHQLGLGPWGYGVLIAVTSLGNVLGGLVAGRVDRRWSADLTLIVAGVVIALAYVLAGATSWVLATGIGLFFEAIWVSIGTVTSLSLRHRVIPEHLRGRSMGIFRMMIVGIIPIGSLFGGLMADAAESRTPLILAGGVQLLGVSLLGPRLRSVLRADSRLVLG